VSRPRILIVGAGFAGYYAARTLSRLACGRADLVVINPTDFLYLPLLPEGRCRFARTTPGDGVRATDAARCPPHPGGCRRDRPERAAGDVGRPESRRGHTGYDRLVISVGSVNRLLPIPGAAEHAHGFRGMPEALYLRDHITRQMELADVTDDMQERACRSTFVVVGAGYTGTELTARGVLYTDVLHRRHSQRGDDVRPSWLLIDKSPAGTA
jgi:NADH:ubiquinone reductase (H+-translocating)